MSAKIPGSGPEHPESSRQGASITKRKLDKIKVKETMNKTRVESTEIALIRSSSDVEVAEINCAYVTTAKVDLEENLLSVTQLRRKRTLAMSIQ